MAKLIVLALAFTTLVAFASAHSTIVTTTIEEENPVSRQQCSRQIQGERFNQCQRYLQQGQSWYELHNRSRQQQGQGDLQSCCQELQNVQEQCQCEAVKEAFRQAQSMQQRQQGQQYCSQSVHQMRQRAQNLPNQCNLQQRQCQVGSISITTTTTIAEEEEDTNNRRGSRSMQQCQHVRQRQFNQCQSYIQRQSGSFLMMRQGQQEQSLQQCCNELQNVEQECQCEAMQQVYRQAQQQQQQWTQQRGRRGAQGQQDLRQMVENLRNQCNLQVQQCRVPSSMF